jgi:sulfur carrier protein
MNEVIIGTEKEMKIQLNNREESFEMPQLSISQLLELKNFSFKMLVIKVNGSLIKKTDYETTLVKEGDDVMVLHLISGG